MKTLIAESIVKLLGNENVEEVADMLEIPPEESMGDLLCHVLLSRRCYVKVPKLLQKS